MEQLSWSRANNIVYSVAELAIDLLWLLQMIPWSRRRNQKEGRELQKGRKGTTKAVGSGERNKAKNKGRPGSRAAVRNGELR